MGTFPQERIDHICNHLYSEDLTSIYYVSAQFRRAAPDPASQGRFRQIEITDNTKQSFIANYSGLRLRFIDRVRFKLSSLRPDIKRQCYRDTAETQPEKDEFFTRQIRNLFATLNLVEERAGNHNCGAYRLTLSYPYPGNGNQCPHDDHAQRRTRLLKPEALPRLLSVRSLNIHNVEHGVKLDYRIVVDLIGRLPNLEELKFRTGTEEWTPSYLDEPATLYKWDYDGIRQDTRHDFGHALIAADVPATLQTVNIDYVCKDGGWPADEIHHSKARPNLVAPALWDPFSSSLRILSYHLRELTLRAQIDKTLFWPADDSSPTWPHLQKIAIMFHMVAPSGNWYFQGPRGEGGSLLGYELNEDSYPSDEEEWGCDDDYFHPALESITMHQFRISTNDAMLGPVLASFAKAAARMPELKYAKLWSPLRWRPDDFEDYTGEFDYFNPPLNFCPGYLAWGLAYCAPGQFEAFGKTPGRRKICVDRYLWWEVGQWRSPAAS